MGCGDRSRTAPLFRQEDLPGAVRISGTYRVTGNQVNLRLILRLNDRTLSRLSVTGAKNDKAALIERLMEALKPEIEKLGEQLSRGQNK